VNAFRAVLWKDLVSEWRSRDRLVAMTVFSVLVITILYFSAPPGPDPASRTHLPGLFWIAVVFASVLGLNRSFALELENEALSGLALTPADRGWIFLGKATASLVLLMTVVVLTAFVFGLFFGIDLVPIALPAFGVATLGCIGLSSIGTLFAAIAVRTTYREVMLPLLLLPLLLPVVLSAVRATGALLDGDALPFSSVQLLLVTDGVFLIVSFLSFEYVLDE
jgi:heme exporter protein B